MTSGTALALACCVVAIGVQRAFELAVSRRNERALRAAGARELGAAHYPAFFVLHGGWLLAFPTEALASGIVVARAWPLLLCAFALAQALRYWAIASLGGRWCTRVLVVPGHPRISRGPYRILAHPNYVAVAIELAVVPLAFGATWTALVASIANASLLLTTRIPCEIRALRWAERARQPSRAVGELIRHEPA